MTDGWCRISSCQALLNRDITVYGDGSQTRSFCYVDDLIDGLTRLMGSADDVVGPINIGNPVEFTMLELADLVREITGSRSRIVISRFHKMTHGNASQISRRRRQSLAGNRPRRLRWGSKRRSPISRRSYMSQGFGTRSTMASGYSAEALHRSTAEDNATYRYIALPLSSATFKTPRAELYG